MIDTEQEASAEHCATHSWPVRLMAARGAQPVTVHRPAGHGHIVLDMPKGRAGLGPLAMAELIGRLRQAPASELVQVHPAEEIAGSEQTVPVAGHRSAVLDVAASRAGARLSLGRTSVQLSRLHSAQFRSGFAAVLAAARVGGGCW